MPDVAQHVSAAWAQVKPLARHVLRNPSLPFAKKRLILNSLAFSAASGTAATWGPLNGQETRAWRTGYVRLVRLLGRDDRHTGQPSLPAKVMSAKPTASPLRLRTCAQSGYFTLPGCFSRKVRFGISSGQPIAFCLSPGSTSCGRTWNGWLASARRPAPFCVTSLMDLQNRPCMPLVLSALLCVKQKYLSCTPDMSHCGGAVVLKVACQRLGLFSVNTARQLLPLRSSFRRTVSANTEFAALQPVMLVTRLSASRA